MNATQTTSVGDAVCAAVGEQAALLALLLGSVGPIGDAPPTGAVDLIGALGPLDRDDVPGPDPLRAFASVAPRFVQDAEQVVTDLGGRAA
ncbi:hypothetical protein [Cryptosporangium phraense]|uniref:Uncharacterized protein n=1 Tax=Cryptosporangium phraense TaxID=2593070 RepID=A0A545AE48_9ACTN|nr:hypothetical protein [Cryptosporangium phraense]TQS39611.1 hypothetical protein FL583_39130 [Cryptosporangium phraense]